jgi:CRP-like cAMP-binding protein
LTAMQNKKTRVRDQIPTSSLSELSIFKGMDTLEIEQFLSLIQGYYVSFEKGEFIGLEGEKISGIGVLLSGSAVVLKENATGERHRMATLLPGDIFGEVAVYTGDIWTASVLAEDRSMVLFLPKKELVNRRNLSEVSVQFQLNMLSLVSRKTLKLNQKLEILSMRSLRQKLIHYLRLEWNRQKCNPIFLSMNREELAEYLQVSRPALSRELMEMKKENLIEYHKNEVILKDWFFEIE